MKSVLVPTFKQHLRTTGKQFFFYFLYPIKIKFHFCWRNLSSLCFFLQLPDRVQISKVMQPIIIPRKNLIIPLLPWKQLLPFWPTIMREKFCFEVFMRSWCFINIFGWFLKDKLFMPLGHVYSISISRTHSSSDIRLDDVTTGGHVKMTTLIFGFNKLNIWLIFCNF